MTVLPGLTDKYRNQRNGTRKWVGQVCGLTDDGKWIVLAEVYGSTIDEMRARKHAACAALRELEVK